MYLLCFFYKVRTYIYMYLNLIDLLTILKVNLTEILRQHKTKIGKNI